MRRPFTACWASIGRRPCWPELARSKSSRTAKSLAGCWLSGVPTTVANRSMGLKADIASVGFCSAPASAVHSRPTGALLGCCLLLLLHPRLFAVAPELKEILPTGGQRGTDLEVSFIGERLQDSEQVLCFDSAIQVVKLDEVTNKVVKAQIKIAPDAPLG